MKKHIHCRIKKGNKFQTAWIPEVYAHMWNSVTYKGKSGWEIVALTTKYIE